MLKKPDKQLRKARWGTVGPILFALLAAVLIRTFIIQLYWIPTPSMEPQLMVGDGIVANKARYLLTEPKRGDILVFKYPLDQRVHFVKRVIGLPGDKVEIKDNTLNLNGAVLTEPYLAAAQPMPDYGPVEVPPGHYFMMGDSREGSQDSRVWGFLPRNLIIGEACYRFWPFSRLSVIQ